MNIATDIPPCDLLILYIWEYYSKKDESIIKAVLYIYPTYKDSLFFKGYEMNMFNILKSNKNYEKFNEIGYYQVTGTLKETAKTKKIYFDKILEAEFINKYRFQNLPTEAEHEIFYFVFAFSNYPKIEDSRFPKRKKIRLSFHDENKSEDFPLFSPFKIHILDPYYCCNSTKERKEEYFQMGYYSIRSVELDYQYDLTVFDDIGLYSLNFLDTVCVNGNVKDFLRPDNIKKIQNYEL